MHILVIGGTRFMGPFLVQQLLDQGHRVTLFHRERCDAGAIRPDVPHVHGDRHNLQAHREELRALAPDVVVDMVCMTAAHAHALHAVFAGVASRVVVASSMDVYLAYGRLLGTEPGEPLLGPMAEEAPKREKRYMRRLDAPRAEDDPDRWKDDYEKLDVEPIVLGWPDLPGVVLRLPMVYGPGDFQHRLWEWLPAMEANRPKILLDTPHAHWRAARGYVENMAAALALCATHPAAGGRTYNVADRPALTEANWVRGIGMAARWPGEVLTRNAPSLAPEINVTQDWLVDDTRLREELGYTQPVAFQTALARAVTWERANPPEDVDATERFALEDALV